MNEVILLVPLNVFREWTGTDLPFLHFQGSGKFKRPLFWPLVFTAQHHSVLNELSQNRPDFSV